MIIMFLAAEMMLQGVAINLTAFARFRGNLQGQAFVLFIIAVAAAEAAIALALILALYRRRRSLDVSLWQDLREPDQPPVVETPEAAAGGGEGGPTWPEATPPRGGTRIAPRNHDENADV